MNAQVEEVRRIEFKTCSTKQAFHRKRFSWSPDLLHLAYAGMVPPFAPEDKVCERIYIDDVKVFEAARPLSAGHHICSELFWVLDGAQLRLLFAVKIDDQVLTKSAVVVKDKIVVPAESIQWQTKKLITTECSIVVYDSLSKNLVAMEPQDDAE